MITIQKYVRAQSLEEAYQLNQNKRNRILGGMLWLKLGKGAVNTAIDLSDLGLDAIEETPTEFRIGTMVSLRQLEQHPGLNAYTQGAVANAVKDIVGVQFRNMATVGGSIWGRFGFSDVLTLFLTMDCQVELYKAGSVALEAFAQGKKDRDILTHLVVKKTPGRFRYSAMRIQRTDFPVLTCALAEVGGEKRLAVGARPGRAQLLRTRESWEALPQLAARTFATGSNIRGSAAYRTHLIEGLTRRAGEELGGME